MMPGVLIGLTGEPGSGKDTCAALLHQHGFRSIAFADAVRVEVAEAWRLDQRMLTDRATKEQPIDALALWRCTDPRFVRAMVDAEQGLDEAKLMEPRSARWIMQRWGTEYRRRQNDRYWIDIVARWIGQQREAGQWRLCVTDTRFQNEASAVRALGGHLVQVHRPSLPTLLHGTAEHASQQPLSAPDVIHNDGDIEHLRAELLRVVYRLAPAVVTPWFPLGDSHA